jgi:hypothetical protein
VTYRFLCGADMEPSAARAAFPGGRFVARACLPPAGGAPPAGVWGILLEVPADGAVAGDATLRVVTDDGRPFAAVGEAEPHGDPAAVLAAARYWELPPAYVRTLPGWADPGEARS